MTIRKGSLLLLNRVNNHSLILEPSLILLVLLKKYKEQKVMMTTTRPIQIVSQIVHVMYLYLAFLHSNHDICLYECLISTSADITSITQCV